MRINGRNRLLAAAVAAVAPVVLAASVAHAQYRVGEDGHALDANNRVGGGGVNDVNNRGNSVNGNDLVTGNVTGGRQFRGGIGYTDPWAFRSRLSGRGVDSFIRDSSGVPTPYSPSFSLDQPRSFYGQSRGVAAPEGTVRIGASGSYVGTDLEAQNPYSSSLLNAQLSTIQDNRIGGTQIVGYGQDFNGGLLSLPGSIDSSEPNMKSVLLATPLTGVVQMNGQGANDNFVLERYLATRRSSEGLPQNLDNTTIQQMQQELQLQSNSALLQPNPGATRNGTSQNPNGQTTPGGPNNLNGNGPNGPDGLNQKPLGSDQNSGTDSDTGSTGASIPNKPIGTAIQPQVIGQGGANEGMRQRLMVPPSRQSAQYAELQNRLEHFNADHPMNDQQANRVFREQQRLLAAHNKNGPGPNPRTGPGATRPAVGPASQPAVQNPNAPAEHAQPPEKIISLATGVKAKGLHDLLASAEELMRADKFASAIQKYNDAERVAPNNPLIALGRAHAELGAAYYGKAEADLRRVFTLDPALLMGQFDLSSFMNAQRLEFVRKDLKDLTASEPKSERPWFLLAYIAYSTGDPKAAAEDLNEAQKRAPINDRVIPMMRSHWSLPTDAQPQLNK